MESSLSCSPSIVRVVQSMFEQVNLLERFMYESLSVDGRTILKLIIKK